MSKREAVLAVLDTAQPQSYVPAAFFLHFAPECHAGQAAIDKHLEFFRYTGMDFLKVQYEQTFPCVDEIVSPRDWARVPVLDRDFFAPQLDVVEGLVKAVGREALVVVTLYSPFMCAGHVSNRDTLRTHLAQDPEAVIPGLEAVTRSVLTFVRACIDLGVDGFYHSTQGGEADRLADPALFATYVKPYDLAVMNEAAAHCRFNILHVCDYHRDEYGGYEDLASLTDYPGHVVNCSLDIGGRTWTPQEVSHAFGRPFMGGMDRLGPLLNGTEEEVRTAAREALSQAPPRFILGADCTVPTSNWANLRAAIDEAHRTPAR